jgi:hypothetical protein
MFTIKIKVHTMQVYGGMEAMLHIFLTSAQNGVEWSVVSPGEKAHGPCKGGIFSS